jgi:transcriptional regulator with XRE-family HTH domain
MPSFGESMKRERELRQITLREISEATKISLRYLDALERDDFRHLPGGVFNKGFVRAFAQYIGVDAEAMVTAYLQEEQGQQARVEERKREALHRSAGAGSSAATRLEPRGTAPERKRSVRGLLVSALVLALLLIAIGGYLADRRWDFASRWLGGAAPTAPASDSPASSPSEAASREAGFRINAQVVMVRPTQGALNCDDRERRSLDGLPGGAGFTMTCKSFLLVDAEDGGAVRLGIDGAPPVTLGPDGQPVRGHRIEPQHGHEAKAGSAP